MERVEQKESTHATETHLSSCEVISKVVEKFVKDFKPRKVTVI